MCPIVRTGSAERACGMLLSDREIAGLVQRLGVESQRTGGVLLVDDEELNLQVLRQFLEDRWRVHEAASGAEALAIAEKVPLDVVVADQRMPGMTGVEMLAELRRRRPDVAGIVLTAFADMPSLEGAINRANVFRFMRKPWQPREIVEVIEQASAFVVQRRTIEKLVQLLANRSEELRASLDELQAQQQMLLHLERLGTMGKLAAGVTHDLRNLMVAFRALESETANLAIPGPLREILSLGLRGVENMVRTLGTLHEFAKTGALSLDLQAVDPAAIVRDAVAIADDRGRIDRLQIEGERSGLRELVQGAERPHHVLDAPEPEGEDLAERPRDGEVRRLRLERTKRDHEVPQVVGHARRELAHRAEALEVEEHLLLRLQLVERRAELLAAIREELDELLDGAPLHDERARLLDDLDDLAGLPRLAHEPEDVGAVDRALERRHVGEGGEHDPGDVGSAPAELREHLDARHARHALIGDHDVERHLLRDRERLRARRRLVDAPAVFQELAQDLEVQLLVVDEQHSARPLALDAEPLDQSCDLAIAEQHSAAALRRPPSRTIGHISR